MQSLEKKICPYFKAAIKLHARTDLYQLIALWGGLGKTNWYDRMMNDRNVRNVKSQAFSSRLIALGDGGGTVFIYYFLKKKLAWKMDARQGDGVLNL